MGALCLHCLLVSLLTSAGDLGFSAVRQDNLRRTSTTPLSPDTTVPPLVFHAPVANRALVAAFHYGYGALFRGPLAVPSVPVG